MNMEQICRFCLNPIDSCANVGELEESLLQKCTPEVDIKLTHERFLCEICFNCLENYFNFLTSCQDVESKLDLYCKTTNKKGPVDLISILKYSLQFKLNNGGRSETKKLKPKVLKVEHGKVQIRPEDKKKMLGCNICDFRTMLKGVLRKHNRLHKAAGDVAIFKCSLCDHTTKYRNSLKKHMWRLHKTVVGQQKIYKCDICDYDIMHKKAFEQHTLKHKDPDALKMFKCSECDYKTAQKGNLRRHMIKHNPPDNQDIFTCDRCGYATTRRCNLNKHNFVHHSRKEKVFFECDKCGFQSKTKHSLIRHYNVRHKRPEEVELYPCDLCEYRAKEKGNLKQHMLVHKNPNDLEQFSCDLCNYKSIRVDNFRRHRLIHKPSEKLELFKCEFCSFTARRKREIKRHMMVHQDPNLSKPFKCKECDFGTNRKYGLSKHVLTHRAAPENPKTDKPNRNSAKRAKQTNDLEFHRLMNNNGQLEVKKAEYDRFGCETQPLEETELISCVNLVERPKAAFEFVNCRL